MITRFITEVNTKFNPFSMRSRATRLFLSYLPPHARSEGMQINTTLLPRTSTEANSLIVKFSAFPSRKSKPKSK
jgi:large subunit ribosomal protein L53